MPVIEDILPELSKAKIFTKVDCKDGYWQIKLTEESSFLTTFATPFGRYKWNRMPFGTSPNLVPRVFSLAWGRDGKRPWHRLVTCPPYTLKLAS